MMKKHFRQCAGAVVFNRDGKVLLGCRNDVKKDSWQVPQGGIEKGEKPFEAAQRELMEETSVSSVRLIHQDTEGSCYEFPENIRENFQKHGIHSDGQNIYFSLFFFEGKDSEINLKTKEPEFRKYIWEDLDFAVQNIISFKKDVYIRMAERLKPIISDFIRNLP